MRLRRGRPVEEEIVVVEALTQDGGPREPQTDSQWIYQRTRPNDPGPTAWELQAPTSTQPAAELTPSRTVLVNAERRAREIMTEARQRAEAIMAEADERARLIVLDAETSAERIITSAQAERAGAVRELALIEAKGNQLLALMEGALAAMDDNGGATRTTATHEQPSSGGRPAGATHR